jgi:phosphoglycerol transferase MdoB-like AlkP superfamily enzyme
MRFLRWPLGAAVAVLTMLSLAPLLIGLAMNGLMHPDRWLFLGLLAIAVTFLSIAVYRLFRGGAALSAYALGAAAEVGYQALHSNGAVIGLASTLELLPLEALIVAFHAVLGLLIWLTERRKATA